MTPKELIEALRRPEAYSHPCDGVELLQTHVSLLFFAGDLVYKVKKTVNLGFLDFTTLEARRHFCEEEVRLNRRLAPWVYLGVVEITRGVDGVIRAGGAGDVVDYAVQMKRLPARSMLGAMIDRGEIDNDQLNELVDLLVEFHARAPTGPGVDEYAAPEELRRQVEENLEGLRVFVGDRAGGGGAETGGPIVSETLRGHLQAWTGAFLQAHDDLLRRRVREGRIRDGHGDLHAGNICFTDRGIVAYDCIEFTPRFRCRDVAAELAFLAMDLDARGYRGFARYLIHRYAERSGDADLDCVVILYKVHFAAVRGKVHALRSADPQVDEAERAAAWHEARRYLQLAAACTYEPVLILMCGLPASGKSWAARHLAGPFEAVMLRSDVIRKQLAGVSPTEHGGDGLDEGLYAPEMSRRTFETMLGRAREHLEAGRSVIVDATFVRADRRAPFIALARELDRPFVVAEARCPDDVIRSRMRARAGDPAEVSDAGPAVYERMKANYEPPDEVSPGARLPFGPETSGEDLAAALLDRLATLLDPATPEARQAASGRVSPDPPAADTQ